MNLVALLNNNRIFIFTTYHASYYTLQNTHTVCLLANQVNKSSLHDNKTMKSKTGMPTQQRKSNRFA